MKLNVTLLLFSYLISFICYGSNESHLQNDGEKPNIIFILTDDQRWDALGYAGNALAHTPEMDKLAQEGTYFKNGFVTTPICAGSRASILSGLYERTHAYNFQTGPLKDEYVQMSYPRIMKDAGYHTGFFGKLGVNFANAASFFDVFDDYDRNNSFKDRRGYFYKTLDGDTVHLTRYTGQQALDFIEQSDTERPFCLSLSFSAPHAHDPAELQFFWQNETNHLLQDIEIPKAPYSDDAYFNSLPEAVKAGFNRLRWTWRFDTPEKYQHSVKGYYRMIAGIDMEIAKIRQQLKKKGLDQNTIIILMGDNGYFLGERQLAGKWLMYENSIKVPLIIYDPRANLHQDVDLMALNIDIPATLLDYAGIDIPESYQGKSLKPVVSGASTTVNRDTILIEHLWEFANIPPSEGLRTAEWKYFRYINDKSVEELYHIKNDPDEIVNLAGSKKHHEILAKMRRACDALTAEKADNSTAAPERLSIEFIREPSKVKILTDAPVFGWQVPVQAVYQSAWQILVASSRENIDKNIGDVWNSGAVRSRQSHNISYAGTALKPGQRYFWKVRIWDQHNRLSRYSDHQTFRLSDERHDQITTPNIFQLERISPSSISKTGNNAYFIDFGKAAFASLEFSYTTRVRDTVIVRIGEQLEDGSINRNPQGHIRYQEIKVPVHPRQSSYTIKIAPDKRNATPPAVLLPDSIPILLPFRYCELENFKNQPGAEDIFQLAYFGYFDEHMSSFNSSDTILNQIWDLCKYSMKATSFAGIYVDGDRERIPYEADAYINQLSHYAVDPEYAIGRRSIEYFMEYPTWPTEWQLHVALMFFEDYMYTGNTALIEKYYDELKHKTLMELAREDGLISSELATPEFMKKLGFKDPNAKMRDIVDWPPAQKDTGWKLATAEGERDGYVFKPINTVINSLHFRNLEIMAAFARLLGKADEALAFESQALKVKQAINSILLDRERGIYIDGEGTDHASLHANMMPLAFNIVPEAYVPSVVAFIKTRGMACSVYGAQYLLDGLYNAGEDDYALELMTATHDRSWWNMIAIGSTITLEAWDMKYKPNADWNHAWGAVPGNVIARKMWGIAPQKPGAAIVNIAPQLGSLQFSEIEVPFLGGIVKASYKFVNSRMQRYEIELPANVSGELTLKSKPNDSITLNGKSVNMAFGTIRLSPGKNLVELRVNSF
ncbi:MAG: sulfatase-like hydrolase/transferase [Cyclobacteriaceae bacterium]|nr:sulfatase-like hydrolase/transferase [Cyclobacteriaceae bacterium]